MKAAFVSLLALASLSAGVAQARPLTTAEKLADLDQLVTAIRSGYGPLQYKAQADGIRLDLSALREKYATRAQATKTNAEFYYLIPQLIAEFQDSHFSATVPSTLAATLPFTTDLVQGKVLIDTVDRKQVSEAKFPFYRGDELVELGGRPIAEVVAELQKQKGAGYEPTAHRMAAMAVTVRAGSVYPVPKGDVTLKIRHGDSAFIEETTLTWKRTGAALDEDDAKSLVGRPAARDYDDLSMKADWAPYEIGRAERSFRCSGTTRIAIPKDATVIMDDPFVAYYHPTAQGNVGYLRIPHYSFDKADEVFAQYEYAVSVLEKNTVGLIIDQDHNCGGSVEWLHRIVSLFMDKPFAPMQFQLLATKPELLEFRSWVDETPENTIAHLNQQKVVELVQSTWEKGDFMTAKTSIDGTEAYYPNGVRYSKPIIMLIDELSGSGGDAFPSLMQGYGRAKLLGTRTMGAGGHVVEQPDLPFSKVHFRMTKSLFYRPDGVAVENHGAVPDIAYQPTRDDFVYGYRGYQAFYLNELSKLIK